MSIETVLSPAAIGGGRACTLERLHGDLEALQQGAERVWPAIRRLQTALDLADGRLVQGASDEIIDLGEQMLHDIRRRHEARSEVRRFYEFQVGLDGVRVHMGRLRRSFPRP